ncbi:MAG TPA: hypothetical protein VLW50_22130 [Streptosporangiaceae bacterium]|nr:hypothetical protein [Streptosporangiaceae bacterium]
MPSRSFGAVDLVAKPLDVKTWPTRPVSGLAAGLSLAGRRELFAAGGCSRMLAG